VPSRSYYWKNVKQKCKRKTSRRTLKRLITIFIEGIDQRAVDQTDLSGGIANPMLHRITIIAAWAYLAFIVFATLSPIGARPVLANGSFTLLERFGAYAVLGLLFSLAYPRDLAFVCIMVFGSAITLELLQNLVPDRDPRLADAIEKLFGGTMGLVLGRIFHSSFSPKSAQGSVGAGSSYVLLAA
jgi:VanZ family protein